MKIKTRLLLYNILIIILSLFIVFTVFNYIRLNTSKTFYNVNTITIDENAHQVERILNSSPSIEAIEINLKRYRYDLYVYEDKKLIYGEENSSITKLLKNYISRGDITRTIFLDNKTAVMKVEENRIYFAMQEEMDMKEMPFFPGRFNPFQQLLIKIIILVIIALIIILFFVIFFSNRIFKRVMIPVNKLKDGAEKIEEGNYNEVVEYKENDEFASLIDNFNSMQKSLKEKTEKAKKYEQAKKEMINGISHDIRTPLTVVKGNIKGIQDGIANTKEKRDRYLKIAYSRAKDIENLLNRLFDTFNYETGEIKLELEQVSINEYINDILVNNENLLNKKVLYNLDLLEEDIKIDIDKIQFKRIFDNLVNNSIKYNEDKKDLAIDVKVWIEKELIKISYKDNGIGVKEENIEKIFDEFFKEDESRNNDKNSSGMGLYIVKKIVEAHKGTILAKNDNGLYFEISLIRGGKLYE